MKKRKGDPEVCFKTRGEETKRREKERERGEAITNLLQGWQGSAFLAVVVASLGQATCGGTDWQGTDSPQLGWRLLEIGGGWGAVSWWDAVWLNRCGLDCRRHWVRRGGNYSPVSFLLLWEAGGPCRCLVVKLRCSSTARPLLWLAYAAF